MKVIINILTLVSVALCEVPPPYPTRGFRPSPPFTLPTKFSSSQIRQPQKTYGVPSATAPQIAPLPVPQTQYGVPNNVPRLTPSSSSKQTIPGTSYGVPVTDNESSRNTLRIVNNPLQNQYQNQPQIQYGAPSLRDIETLEQIRKLSLLLQSKQAAQSIQRGQQSSLPQFQNFNKDIPNTQYLPQREPNNFRVVGQQTANANLNTLQSQNLNRNIAQPNVQYLPSREIAHFQITSTEFDTSTQSNQNLNQNIQQLNQPKLFLPVKEATNFKQDFQLEPDIQRGINPNPSASNSNFASSNNQLPQKTTTANQFQLQNLQQSGQYVPSEETTATRPNIPRRNNNQPIPQQNFNQRQPSSINDILSQPNSNPNGFQQTNQPNSFQQTNQPNNFDIEPADVRKLEPPNRNANINRFQNQNVRPNKQNTVSGERIEVATSRPGETYLVPTTTTRNFINRPRPVGRPNVPSTTTVTPNQDNDESSEADEEAGAGGPNVAIATAVSGLPAGQGFYLLQPDGRLQRVIYPKTREGGNQENEYTANYLFQNIQADPNLIYSPLITLGK